MKEYNELTIPKHEFKFEHNVMSFITLEGLGLWWKYIEVLLQTQLELYDIMMYTFIIHLQSLHRSNICCADHEFITWPWLAAVDVHEARFRTRNINKIK